VIISSATAHGEDFSQSHVDQLIERTWRIANPVEQSVGSAVAIRQTDSQLVLLTAAHVVGKATTVTIERFTVESYPRPSASYQARVTVSDSLKDLAVLTATVSEDVPTLAICPTNSAPTRKVAVMWCGCPRGAHPTATTARLTTTHRCLIPRYDSNGTRKLYKGGRRWEISGAPIPGQSGGPLIAADTGYLIGICSTRNSDTKGGFCHITDIHQIVDAAATTTSGDSLFHAELGAAGHEPRVLPSHTPVATSSKRLVASTH
jgi:S1-C subfamily serine protease